MPADRPVAISGDDEPVVGGNVDAPSDVGDRDFPDLGAAGVETAEPPIGAEHEAAAAGAEGERARPLVLIERDRLAGEGGVRTALPILDRETLDERFRQSRH